MYNVSSAYQTAIYQSSRVIAAKLEIGEDVYTEAELQTLTVEESVNAGDDLAVGSCCSSTLDLTILNTDGVLNAKNLAGKTVKPYIGLQLSSSVEYVPLGVFVASDAAKKNGSVLTLKAFDKMAAMEQPYDTSTVTYPCTLLALLTDLCLQAGIELSNTTIPNGTMTLQEGFFGMDLTCRAMLTYVAQAAGCFARFDRVGKLELAWYADSGVSITADNYMTATIAEHTMPAITKLTIKTEEGDLGVSIGTGEAEYSIVGNPVLYANPQAVLQGIHDSIGGMAYTPMEVAAQGNPALQAGDLITLTTLDGQAYQVPIMTHKVEYNGGAKSTMTAVGKSETDIAPRGTVNAKIIALQKQANVFDRTLTETVSRIENTETDLDTIHGNISELRQTTEGLTATVSETQSDLDRVTGKTTELENRTGALELSSEQFQVQISEVKTEVDGIQVGGRNLLLKSDVPVSTTGYPMKSYYFGDDPPVAGQTYTIQIKGELGEGKTHFGAYNSGGSVRVIHLDAQSRRDDGVYCGTVTWPASAAANTHINVYSMPQATGVTSTIDWIKLERGNKPTDYTKAPEDVDAAINNAIVTATERSNAAIDVASNAVLTTVSHEYSTKSELAETREYTDTQIQQTSTDVVMRFTTVQEAVDLLEDKVDRNKLDMEEYIRFAGAMIELGKRGSPFVAKLDNTKLAFLQDGQEIAYVSNNKLYITDVEIKNKLTIGNATNGYFDFLPRVNGNLSIVWRAS